MPESWDADYTTGVWNALATLPEQAHYSIILMYLELLAGEASILDVGCGEGLLARRLGSVEHEYYLGIDCSPVAIGKCKSIESTTTAFEVADAEHYVPDRQFDVIVFNESLYYFVSPDAVLRRYSSYLRPGGFFVISLFRHLKGDAIGAYVKRTFRIIDETQVRNNRGLWQCMAVAAANDVD